MKCTRGRESRFLVCLRVFRPSRVISDVIRQKLMTDDVVSSYLSDPNERDLRRLLDDERTVFWVDWRAEETQVIELCENVLRTGDLAFELDGEDLFVVRGGKRHHVPLTFSPADRHIAICSLNDALSPDFEIRFCVASNGMDTLAFLPLSVERWRELEADNDQLCDHFAVISEYPNLFTDGYGRPNWRHLADEPGEKLNAVRAYRDQFGCSLREAKNEVDRYIFLRTPANELTEEPTLKNGDHDDPRQGTLF